VDDLTSAAADGPMVIVNVSDFGSHALILTGRGVLDPIPLAGLTSSTVLERVVGFIGALDDIASSPAISSGRASAEQQITDTLRWLWDAITGPVLDRLGLTGPPAAGQPWPRLWWCVSGLLSFLPLHAAGHHDTRFDAAPRTVIDRVMSSYTPTIRALTHARRTRPPTTYELSSSPTADGGNRSGNGNSPAGLGGGRVVAVAMPHTPGATDLPGTEAEAALLQRRFPGRVSVLAGPQATHEAVLAALPAARWAHFACHGYADIVDPSASHLLLADHRRQPLTVADVARLRLDDAHLAFLSACETAQPGARLSDEAIHLTSAFQLAGYRHVIGTLWPIGDTHAVAVADDIYTTIAVTGDIPGAVHTATRRLRNRWADSPSAWASHIHVGA
jgi:hypothetical protein